MDLKFHKTLSEDRWAAVTFARQLLMIANELNRAQHWLERNDADEVRQCYERAIELLSLTISVTKRHSALRELTRFQELLGACYVDTKQALLMNAGMLKALLSMDADAYEALPSI